MIRGFFAALFILVMMASGASAQVQPSGTFTPGHTFRVLNPSGTAVGDSGGAAGSSQSGQGYLTELGVTNTGLPVCVNDALTNSAGGYHQFCIGSNLTIGGNHGGFLTYNAQGGASALPLFANINGTTYEFPFNISGIVGPGTTVINDVVCWNNTSGTLVSDCGPDGRYVLNASQFNIPAHGTDGTVQAQAAISAAAALGIGIYFPTSFDFTNLALPPKQLMICGGPSQVLHRSGTQGIYSTDVIGNLFPTAFVAQGPHIVNCSVDGGGHNGTNFLFGETERVLLDNISSTGSGNSGAAANISIAANTLTVNSVYAGTVAIGQAVLCVGCEGASNTYGTIASGSGSTWTVTGIAGTVSNVDAILAPAWTYTNAAGAHTIPTANVTFLGGALTSIPYQQWRAGTAGSGDDFTCSTRTPIGIFIDTTTTGGSNKMNQSAFSGIDATCNYLGMVLANGADNWFYNMSFENNLIGIFAGGGAQGAGQNHWIQPYFEGSVSTPMVTPALFTVRATRNEIVGTGSDSNVTNGWENSGSTNFWRLTSGVRATDTQNIIDTYWPTASLGEVSSLQLLPPFAKGRMIDGDDAGDPLAETVMSWGTGISYVEGGHANGTHASPTGVVSPNVLAVFGSFGVYDTTLGHIKQSSRAYVQATETWSSTAAGSKLIIATVANTTTTVTDRWVFDQDGSLHGSGLNARGAGILTAVYVQSATQYTVGASPGPQIPGCAGGTAGSHATVADGAASPAYHDAYSGGGAAIQPVFCNGSGWVYE